jgi:flagellar hook-associated protein 3 FlgL
MRITDNRMIALASAATAKSQERVATTADQVSSGLRVAKPSDDPAAWLAAERTKLQRTLSRGADAAVQASHDRLAETDGALASIGDIVSQVRTLAVQGANATYNASDRAKLAVEVHGLFQSALGAANTRAADGEYVLAGTNSLTPPFDATGAYQGDAIARQVPSGETTSSIGAIPGSELTASAGVDVLPLLDRVATALAANDTTSLTAALGDLETATKQVGLARTRAGGAMSVLEQTTAAHAQLEDTFAREISRDVEVDSVAAASSLAQASQSLEVSRVVSAHVISLLSSQSST